MEIDLHANRNRVVGSKPQLDSKRLCEVGRCNSASPNGFTKIQMPHTKLLVSLVLAIPFCAPAQDVPPCSYGLPCVNTGGSPGLVSPHPLADIIQGKTEDTEVPQVDVYRCDGLVGNSWLACNYVNTHGCRRPTRTEWYAAPLNAETLRLAAAVCGWK